MLKPSLRYHLSGREHDSPQQNAFTILGSCLRDRTAQVAVLGLGYAGLPMAVELARAGFSTTGLDVASGRVQQVNEGRSPVSDVADSEVSALVNGGHLRASGRFDLLAEADCALICVPTPLTDDRQPDLQFVEAAARSIAAHLHSGMLVVLQSTCSPGTTQRVVLPILESRSGLQVGEDFFVAFAPERIDPGNRKYTVRNTPKVVGGVTPRCTELTSLLFAQFIEHVFPVSSPEVAEMSKLLENSFRFINISFVNEMALLCDRIGISIWDVLDAAATKPFAFMPHYPGPGVGGHCIPIVPFYLEAAAREHGMVGGMVEAAGQVNQRMPNFVVEKTARLLAARGIPLEQARILVLGVTYKPDISDIRESPALVVVESLIGRAARVCYYDPFVPHLPFGLPALHSLTEGELRQGKFDCALLLTAHSNVDYAGIAARVGFLLDTRNHLRGEKWPQLVRL